MASGPKHPTLLSHDVYFSLHDPSPAAAAKLVEACKMHLLRHPGVLFFAAGTLCRELERPVNDRGFDVALHIVFRDKASHDAYQKAAGHIRFIEENKPDWKQVRVFDSFVERLEAEGP